MSAAMLSSVSASLYQFAGAKPVTATSAPSTSPANSARQLDRDGDDRPRFRENTLVSAMMAAFQALGIGQAAASATTPPAATPSVPATSTATTSATSAGTGAAATTTAPVASSVTSTAAATGTTAAGANTATTASSAASATTATAATDATPPAADTLEKAVNEFAHALFSVLHHQGHNGQSEASHGGEHGHHHGDQQSRGYNGFAQRLEQLAQSLGAAPATSASASASPGASASATPAVSNATSAQAATQASSATASSASTSTVSSADAAASAPSRGVTRLLAAFSHVLDLLQAPAPVPATSASTTSANTTTTTAAGTAASTADKLKLFLTTLAQSLHSGASATAPSPLGSQVNVTV